MDERRGPDPGAEAARWRWHAAMLARAGQLLAAPGDIETALARLARHLVPALADWCVIDVPAGPPATLAAAHIAAAQEGALRARWAALRAQGLGVDGYAALLRGRRSLALAAVPDPGVAAGPRAAYFAALRDLCALAALTVGLQANGRALGALTVAQVRPDRRFDPHDLSLVQRLAQQCALVVENARLHAERERAADDLAEARRRVAAEREEERLRLAWELHDGPVQQLLGIAYHLGVQELAGPRDAGAGAAATPHPGDLRREVLLVATRLRALIGELRPAGLEEFGFPTALAASVTDLARERRGALPAIALDVAAAEDLPPPVARTLFAVAQEALLNALRHADARRIAVTARRRDGAVTLTVRDDGRGFRPPAPPGELARADHFGLLGLTERVELAGGRLRIESAPGAGTNVCARLPLPATGGEDGRADPGAAGG